ncbi:MAG TPA: hypothetical protein VJT16_07740 [Streptosporangiaceae bacterium]|nr:hypothetical protein [Streptosporangiaceae bacterium]
MDTSSSLVDRRSSRPPISNDYPGTEPGTPRLMEEAPARSAWGGTPPLADLDVTG